MYQIIHKTTTNEVKFKFFVDLIITEKKQTIIKINVVSNKIQIHNNITTLI